jgi:hypothetical protein
VSPAQQVFDKNAFKGDDLIGAAAWALPPANAPPWKVVRVRLHPPSGGGLPGSAGEAVFSAQRVRLEVRGRANRFQTRPLGPEVHMVALQTLRWRLHGPIRPAAHPVLFGVLFGVDAGPARLHCMSECWKALCSQPCAQSPSLGSAPLRRRGALPRGPGCWKPQALQALQAPGAWAALCAYLRA